MTTIAYAKGVMAADTGSWAGDASVSGVNKIVRGVDGTLYGVSGSMALCQRFLRDIERHGVKYSDNLGLDVGLRLPCRHPESGSDFIVLVATKDGKIRVLCADGIEEYDLPYFAIGAGSVTAFGALFVGGSAEDAIRATLEHGSGAHGGVMSLRHE